MIPSCTQRSSHGRPQVALTGFLRLVETGKNKRREGGMYEKEGGEMGGGGKGGGTEEEED